VGVKHQSLCINHSNELLLYVTMHCFEHGLLLWWSR